MRIFLAGATGAIGRRLVPLLLAQGHHVTGMVRSSERGRGLGTSLLRQGFHAYALRGVKSVGLKVDSTNPTGAPRLYEREGFVIDGFRSFERAVSDEEIDAIRKRAGRGAAIPPPTPARADGRDTRPELAR